VKFPFRILPSATSRRSGKHLVVRSFAVTMNSRPSFNHLLLSHTGKGSVAIDAITN
jgi:hypothetical protein